MTSWQDRMQHWAFRTLKNKEIGNIFNKTNAYYPEYDCPELNQAEWDAAGHRRMTDELRWELKLNDELEASRIELFPTMICQLDTDVKLAIMAPTGWGLVEAAKDVVGLLGRLVATHGVSPSSDPDKQKQDV